MDGNVPSPNETEGVAPSMKNSEIRTETTTVATCMGTLTGAGRISSMTTNFGRIDADTNLHSAPTNWLVPNPSGPFDVDRLSGFSATPHYTGFSSFRMAANFLEYSQQQDGVTSGPSYGGLEGVDVVSDAENIKQLLRLPFNR